MRGAQEETCVHYIYIYYTYFDQRLPSIITPNLSPSMFHSVGRVREKVAKDAEELAKDTVEQWLGHATEVATTRTVEQRRVAQASLGRAAEEGLVREAQQALDDGADVNAAVFNVFGFMGRGGTDTAVQVAACREHLAVIRDVLIPAGADLDVKGWNGWTPLLRVCHKPTDVGLEIAKVLLEHGADPNVHDDIIARTALHLACTYYEEEECDMELIELLVKHGADVNARDDRGKTPLMYAAIQCGNVECMEALVEAATRKGIKLKVNAVDNHGYTAFDHCRERAEHWYVADDFMRDVLGALPAEELPQPKRPKSAAKVA